MTKPSDMRSRNPLNCGGVGRKLVPALRREVRGRASHSGYVKAALLAAIATLTPTASDTPAPHATCAPAGSHFGPCPATPLPTPEVLPMQVVPQPAPGPCYDHRGFIVPCEEMEIPAK